MYVHTATITITPLPSKQASQPEYRYAHTHAYTYTYNCRRPITSHTLKVIALLDTGLPLAPHRAPELLARRRRRHRPLGRPVLVPGQIDALVRQRDLGRQRLDVALG